MLPCFRTLRINIFMIATQAEQSFDMFPEVRLCFLTTVTYLVRKDPLTRTFIYFLMVHTILPQLRFLCFRLSFKCNLADCRFFQSVVIICRRPFSLPIRRFFCQILLLKPLPLIGHRIYVLLIHLSLVIYLALYQTSESLTVRGKQKYSVISSNVNSSKTFLLEHQGESKAANMYVYSNPFL